MPSRAVRRLSPDSTSGWQNYMPYSAPSIRRTTYPGRSRIARDGLGDGTTRMTTTVDMARAGVRQAIHPIWREASGACLAAAGWVAMLIAAAAPANAQRTGSQGATAATMARVSGVAFDSVGMQPLGGAMIQLVSADNPSLVRSATADARGVYAIDSVSAGTYLLGFFHARLDSLHMQAPLLRVDVQTAGEIRAPIAIPSAATLIARICGPGENGRAVTLFMGRVRSARGEVLSAPARIRAQWVEINVGPRGIERNRPSQLLTTNADGAFALCGLPSEGEILARAFLGPDSSGFVELQVPRNHLLVRDVYVGAATQMKAPATSTTSTTVLQGPGALRGTVRNASGQPIRGARLVLWGSGREDSTNASGQFALQSLPAGTYTMEARAIGYLPVRQPVDVLENGESATDLAMDVFVPTIDTVRVRADRDPRLDAMTGFERRRRSTFGHFLDSDQLERRNAMFMSDMLRQTAGVVITPSGGFGDRVQLRDGGARYSCTPTLFLNGVRTAADDGVLDAVVNPQNVRAVEVYPRTGSVPIEFQGNNGCGSIVIWTGPRQPTPKRP